jgi:hypothetical protein
MKVNENLELMRAGCYLFLARPQEGRSLLKRRLKAPPRLFPSLHPRFTVIYFYYSRKESQESQKSVFCGSKEPYTLKALK